MQLNARITVVRTLFEATAATTKKAEKASYIRQILNNDDAKSVLIFLLNPYITTGVTERTLTYKFTEEATPVIAGSSILHFLLYVGSHNTGKQAHVNAMWRWIDALEDHLNIPFMRSIVCKTFRLGVSARTVNEIAGEEVIPTFEVMLAHKYSEHPEYVRENFFLTEKLDGIRCYVRIERGQPTLFTRQGQVITGLTEMEDELRAIADGRTFDLDGELVVSDYAHLHSKEGYRETIKIVRRNGEKSGVTYKIFDIPSDMAYAARRQQLDHLLDGNRTYHTLEIVPVLYAGDDRSVIQHHLKEICDAGGEGVMINLASAPYEYKRTSALLKVKQMQDCDLMITGVLEGSGRLKETLGSFIVDYKGNPLRVGSGFTDDERNAFWSQREDMIGRVVTVQYFEETTDDTGKPSLRFPVFMELREEGKQVSY